MNNRIVNVEAVRSDGLRFSYNQNDWKMLTLEGVDFPEVEVFSEARGFGHGDIITGIRKHGRQITLSARINGSNDSLRAEVIGFHNANHKYDLYITYAGITKIAKDCVIKAASYPSRNVYRKPNLELLFQSPHADLFGDSKDTTAFSAVNPMWHWTRYYAPGGGKLAFGEITKTDTKVINYLGSEPTPIVITIKSTGYVPGIDIEMGLINTSVKTVLNATDVLVIDCDKRTVKKNGKDVPYSDFDARDLMQMVLGYGDNQIKISKDGNTAFTAEVSFVGRYGGV